MDILAEHQCVGLCRQPGLHRADVVVAVVCHDVVGGYERRHITARLLGQVWVYLPVVALAVGAADGLVDLLRPAVVGCNDQCPVAEHLVQVAQVLRGGVRRLYGVAAFVNERVDVKAVSLSRREHELPQAGGSRARYGRGIECRLYHGHVAELKRKLVGFERLFEYRHVEV